jgi:hypothetical protein
MNGRVSGEGEPPGMRRPRATSVTGSTTGNPRLKGLLAQRQVLFDVVLPADDQGRAMASFGELNRKDPALAGSSA